MLTQEGPDAGRAREPRKPARPRPKWVAPFLVLVFLGVVVLRHDFWNFRTPHPLLFGFLPVGLWWQAMVSILAACMLWLMVRLAWPQHLEDDALNAEHRRQAAEASRQTGHGFPASGDSNRSQA